MLFGYQLTVGFLVPIAGQPCPPVPYVGHGQVVLQPDYNSSVVTRAILSCIPGYLFSDGRPVVNIECENNIWYPEKAFICDRKCYCCTCNIIILK